MYMDNNDTQRTRDRIDEEMLGKMLDGSHCGCGMPDLPPDEHACASQCAPMISWGLHSHPLGMVYAPLQEFTDLYDRNTALCQGTIFRSLDLPFMGESVVGGGCRTGGGCRD